MSEENDVLPRKGSVMFNFMNETQQNKKKTANRFKKINKFLVTPLYRLYILPLLFIGRIILLLYTTGRKSGKRRITPLEFRRYENKVLIFSARGKYGDWFKNATSNPEEVMIKIGFRKYNPNVQQATLEEKYKILQWYMEKYPKAAKSLFGYNQRNDVITNDFMQPIAEFLEILKLSI